MARDVGSGKPRHEKLGLKPGDTVAELAFGVAGDDVVDDVKRAGARLGSLGAAACVFVGVETTADLLRIDAVRAGMRDDAAIWVVWPKGQQHIKEDHVRAHALAGDLVDVKVMSWSPTHSGLRLVVRKAMRQPATKQAAR